MATIALFHSVLGPRAERAAQRTGYFPNKASILDAILDDLLGDVPRPKPRAGWEQGLVSLMRSYRRLLLTQPGLIALTVSRPMIGRNALRLREDMLMLLRRGGLDDADAVIAFLALFAYTTGFVSFEIARTPGAEDAHQRAAARRLYEGLPEADFPSTRALAATLARRPGDLHTTSSPIADDRPGQRVRTTESVPSLKKPSPPDWTPPLSRCEPPSGGRSKASGPIPTSDGPGWPGIGGGS
jgi:Tetracyclin repressor-like, C-terminal domain